MAHHHPCVHLMWQEVRPPHAMKQSQMPCHPCHTNKSTEAKRPHMTRHTPPLLSSANNTHPSPSTVRPVPSSALDTVPLQLHAGSLPTVAVRGQGGLLTMQDAPADASTPAGRASIELHNSNTPSSFRGWAISLRGKCLPSSTDGRLGAHPWSCWRGKHHATMRIHCWQVS